MSVSTIHGIELSALQEVSSGIDTFAGARLVTLGDGAERGVRVVEMRSGGGLEIEVAIDRGGDLGRLSFEGDTLSWHTTNGLRAPWLINSEGDNGQGFLRGVGGFLNTCGLDHIRQPESEVSLNRDVSSSGNTNYPLHGYGAFEPAILRGYGIDEDAAEPYVFCETEFVQSMTFVSALRLRRRIEIPVGGKSISIRDVVTNVGSNSATNMMLYHFNLGFPLVAPGTQLDIIDSENIWVSDDHDPLEAFPSPVRDNANKLSVFKSRAEQALIVVTSPSSGHKLSIEYPTQQLPYCQLLRMTGTGQYGIGIEPCTTGARSRQEARNRDEMINLEVGESRRYDLNIKLEKIVKQGGR